MSKHHCAGCLYAEFRHMPDKVYCKKKNEFVSKGLIPESCGRRFFHEVIIKKDGKCL
jgi:hypothetical protein